MLANNPIITGLICATLAMVLYVLSIAPTFSWGDSADLAMRLVSDIDQTFVGSNRDYVLWRLVGQAAAWLPLQDAGLRANLFTAFWGAVTVGAVAAFVQVTSRSTVAAFAAAGSLAVSHSFWLLSVIAEVYTFNAALVFLSFSCIACWWHTDRPVFLLMTSFFSGLSLAHHATGLVLLSSLVPLVVMRARSINLSVLAFCCVVFALTSAIYWIGVFPRLASDMGLVKALRLKMTQNPFYEPSVPREAAKFVAYLTFNFIGIALILGLIGLVRVSKRMIYVMLPPLFWAAAFIYAGLTHWAPDKFNVYVLVYPTFAILVGLGAAWVVERFALQIVGAGAILGLLLLMPPISYATAVLASRSLDIDLVGARTVPLRNNAAYFLWPPKTGDYGPRIFAESALLHLPLDAILIADYTIWRPILLVQTVENFRTDVQVHFVENLFSEGIDSWINKQECGRRVFIATDDPPQYYQLDKIQNMFDITRFESVYEVQRRCHLK